MSEQTRQKLNEMQKETVRLIGSLSDLEKSLAAIRKQATELWEENDEKLNGKDAK